MEIGPGVIPLAVAEMLDGRSAMGVAQGAEACGKRDAGALRFAEAMGAGLTKGRDLARGRNLPQSIRRRTLPLLA